MSSSPTREASFTQCYESLAKTKRRHHLQSASVVTALPLLTSVKPTGFHSLTGPFSAHTLALPVMILVSLNTPFEWWLGLRTLLLHGLDGEVSLSQSTATYTKYREHRAPCRLQRSLYRPLQLYFLQRQAQWACSFQQMINLLII